MKKILAFYLLLLSTSVFAHNIKSNQIDEMIQSAKIVQKKAYAPYSNYFVGSAILTADGNIYSGCNIENASYPLTNCAERTAVFKAVSEQDHNIVALALVTRDGGMPCGACRQVLNEFNPNMLIVCLDEEGNIHQELYLSELLPHSFGPANLN